MTFKLQKRAKPKRSGYLQKATIPEGSLLMHAAEDYQIWLLPMKPEYASITWKLIDKKMERRKAAAGGRGRRRGLTAFWFYGASPEDVHLKIGKDKSLHAYQWDMMDEVLLKIKNLWKSEAVADRLAERDAFRREHMIEVPLYNQKGQHVDSDWVYPEDMEDQ